MKFSPEHLNSIVAEVFSMYPETNGLPFLGLLATYRTDDAAAQVWNILSL
jgi:hypothetical protein